MSDTEIKQPTHAKIDGEAHLITKIEDHADGPGHTHRVHLACGLTVDVDIGGAKAHARSMQRAEEHDSPHHAREHLAKAERALNDGEQWHHDRWVKHDSKATCDHCAAVETGAAISLTHENAHNATRTRFADIGTGLPCPTCGAQLYIRRATGKVACHAHGHDFTVDEVLATSMGLLHKLSTGSADHKPMAPSILDGNKTEG